MPGDTIGRLFSVTVWGESHGASVGAVIQGCPPGIHLDSNRITVALQRRRPGYCALVSPRREPDDFKIVSGLFQGVTTGAPISIQIDNSGFSSESYLDLVDIYRPGHGDFTYKAKYGIRDHRGGGRSSARLTAPVVAAGAVAAQVLEQELGTTITAFLRKVGSIEALVESDKLDAAAVSRSVISFPEEAGEKQIIELLSKLRDEKDSIGGVVECVVENLPAGLGEPLFSKLDGDLAGAMVGLNGAKGFEMGNGFDCVELTGSQNNDQFESVEGEVRTTTNRCGGVLGGISNGMPLVFRVAFKATPSIGLKQSTVDESGNRREIEICGAHDVCIAIRAVPVVEALAAVVICDHFLRQRGQCGE